MQLDRIVAFHKAMGDPTRIRIVALLASGPLHGQAIAGKLGLTPPTITHHIKKLRDINVIFERREKNTLYFHLNESLIKQQAKTLGKLIEKKEGEVEAMIQQNMERQKVIENFITKDGK